MSDIGSGAQDIAGECAADALHQHQGSALVIRDVLPLETIAGVQMTKRTVWVLEVGISLSEREVQHDPLSVGKLVLARAKFFQPGQAKVAVRERLDAGVVVLKANIFRRDLRRRPVGPPAFATPP